jgi:hypothetical protein
MTKKHISISAIEVFADCPRKYKFQYVDRIYRPSNEHFVFGTLGHRVAEMVGLEINSEVIYDYVEHAKYMSSIQLALETLKITNPLVLVKNYVSALKKFLRNYTLIGTEIKIRDKDNVGVIDLIAVNEEERKLLILDYKFSNHMKTETDIVDNHQLYMYAKLLNSMPDIKKIIKKYNIKHIYLGYVTLSKIEAAMPKRLVKGNLSQSKADKAVTYGTFMKAIELYELDKNDYTDHLNYLMHKTNASFGFTEVKVTKADLDEKIAQIESWTKLVRFAIKNNHFPGRNAVHCNNGDFNKKCGIYKECKNHL